MGDLVLSQSVERYVREARLERVGQGARLHVIAWWPERALEQHLAFAVHGEALGEASVVAEGPALEALRWGRCAPIVVEGVGRDDAIEASERVAIERASGRSVVVLHRGPARVVVWDAAATAAAPAIARGAGGTWVAFHHNLREDTGEPDLTKWIALRFVADDGRVLEPSAPMLDRDRDREGEEQGFELPSLVPHAGGGVTLFGRGSHRFYAQHLDARGFGERTPLGDGTWGCRGRRVAALEIDGGVLTARRERTGIVLSLVERSLEGAPSLVSARLAHPARTHRDVPPRPLCGDPARARGLTTLFGDIHQHSAHSDGCGTADEPFLRARWVYGDDFCALSDHESFLGKRVSPGEWRVLTSAVDVHGADGEFATLHAYEWTGRMHPGPGHKVVYVPDASHAVVSRDTEPTGEGLAARLRGTGAIAVPHHVGWTGADEAAHDPELQPVWEICSCHGCYLEADHPLGQRGDLRDQMIDRVLARGRRFGFIACSDGHGLLRHHGVARKRDPFRTGLTAVLAHERTREAIFEALRARRCYATSGVPIFLDVDADGQPMGSALRVAAGASVTVRVRAGAATPIASIALVGVEGALIETSPNALEGTLEASVGEGWWYARVITADGEMAWSSPVFVDRS